MNEGIKIELTITADAVKALFDLLGLSVERREESPKEESKESQLPTSTHTNPLFTFIQASSDNNNINNNIHDDDVNVANPLSNGKTDIVNEKVTDSVAIPPTMEEVSEYIREKGYDVNPYRFFTYYSRRGWTTKAGAPMAGCWKETLDSWMTNGNTNTSSVCILPVDKNNREALKATHPFIPTEF